MRTSFLWPSVLEEMYFKAPVLNIIYSPFKNIVYAVAFYNTIRVPPNTPHILWLSGNSADVLSTEEFWIPARLEMSKLYLATFLYSKNPFQNVY